MGDEGHSIAQPQPVLLTKRSCLEVSNKTLTSALLKLALIFLLSKY